MAAIRTPAEIIALDLVDKNAIAPGLERDAMRLQALYDQAGRDVVIKHLRSIGMGDRVNADPVQVGTIPRLIEELSTLYEQPATRTLMRGREALAHDDPQSEAFRDLALRMQLDQVWTHIDHTRNLMRQCIVSFAESVAHKSVIARVFQPYNAHRVCTPGVADILDEDDAIALCIRWAEAPEDRIYEVWTHHEDDSWTCHHVTHDGRRLPRQPYGDDGRPAFDGLPMVAVTDELLMGRAWLPVPQGRLALALNVDAVANDEQYLVKMEGHTPTVVVSSDPQGVPDRVGPDQVWKLPADAKAEKLANSPKITEAGAVTDQWLALLALGECLPVNAFSRSSTVSTGAALKVQERVLRRRQNRQAQLAQEIERRAFERYRAVANAYAVELDLTPIDEDLTLLVSYPRSGGQVQDQAEAQRVSLTEVAAGSKSMLEHLADMRGVSLDDARVLWDEVQAMRLEYPATPGPEIVAEAVATTSTALQPGQNPGALVDGPPLPGIDRDKVPGAFNPRMGTASEGASLVDAVSRRNGSQ